MCFINATTPSLWMSIWMSSTPFSGTHVLILLHPHPLPCLSCFILSLPVWPNVLTWRRFSSVNFSSVGSRTKESVNENAGHVQVRGEPRKGIFVLRTDCPRVLSSGLDVACKGRLLDSVVDTIGICLGF
jgi:hypothetical protein